MSRRTSHSAWLCFFLWITLSAVRGSDELEGFTEEDEETVAEVTNNVDPELFDKIHGGESELETTVEKTENKDADPLPHNPVHAWDADEFEGFETAVTREAEQMTRNLKPGLPRRQSIWKKQESYTKEIMAIFLLAVYLANVLFGKRLNEAIAMAWADAFVSDGNIMEMNFSLIGADDQDGEVLLKESHNLFKFYASGRRYCQGLLATLDLKARQDLLSVAINTLMAKQDTLDIDVYMNEVDMGPMVVVLSSPKQLKTLLRENGDIGIYAHEIPVKQIAKWPLDKVNVWTESPDVFYDLMVPEVKNIFLSPDFELVYGKYFRYIYISSDYSNGSHKKVIKFSFNLPPKSKMQELSRWMALVPLLIDLVAEYVPSQEAKKRAEKHRALESERIWKEGAEERKEAFQQKKAEEQQAEMERIRRLSPEEQQKWMEKQQKLKQRRSMKVKTLRG